MSWFGKWFKVTPVATQEDIDVLVNRLNKCESLIKLQERDIQALKAKVQVLLDRPIAQQIHNPNTYVGQVPISLTSDRPIMSPRDILSKEEYKSLTDTKEVIHFPMPDDCDGRYQGTGGNFTVYKPYDENGKATKDALLERDPEGMGNGNSFIGKIDVH